MAVSYRVPYEKLSVEWAKDPTRPETSFALSLPWVSMNIDVDRADQEWIQDATSHLHTNPQNSNVQRFVKDLKEYLVSYVHPRKLEEFNGKDLQECPPLTIDASTPSTLLATFGCPVDPSIKGDVPDTWTWDHEKILSKARIEGTDLYDPVSFVSYLMCYRLELESKGWTGKDGFGIFLNDLLQKDEQQFFQAVGWITKQAWYITSNFCQAMEPGLIHFSKAKDLLQYYIADEAGHNKFMEQVFKDLDLDKDDFPSEPGSIWLIDAYKRAAAISLLTFTAMINIFEVVYCDGQEEPTSRLLKRSSRPQAAHGYDLHYKINREHRHCDMPLSFAPYLAPQGRSHLLLALGVFELTSIFFDQMEQRLAQKLQAA